MTIARWPRIVDLALVYLPVTTRVPLKFGHETLTQVQCARVRMTIADPDGRTAVGWGETPLSVPWTWPSQRSYAFRLQRLQTFCERVARAWSQYGAVIHPLHDGWRFLEECLPELRAAAEQQAIAASEEPLPHLAALVCCSPFDLALHDAWGQLHDRDIWRCYDRDHLPHDLACYFASDDFAGQFPCDYFQPSSTPRLTAWHLVGGLDPLRRSEVAADAPQDGYPVALTDWIEQDRLRCLKIKLRGNDSAWDYQRLLEVGRIAIDYDIPWLSADFNCTVTDPAYVIELLDRLRREHTEIDRRLLYVEQPFPYDLEQWRIDVNDLARRKPLFMDESAHDWRLVRLGRSLGWNGVALKTCKTQTGAILAACWARAHGMSLMVQDLTNPMLAQIPHLRLAAELGTIQGVETNSMQFYPDASAAEACVHPGLYRRRDGCVDLQSIRGAGFGYRIEEIHRTLPRAAWSM